MPRTKPKPEPRSTLGTRGVVPPRPPSEPEPDTVYTPEETAGFLQCTKRTLRALVEDGRIAYLPLNKRQKRFLGSDILDYQRRDRVRAIR